MQQAIEATGRLTQRVTAADTLTGRNVVNRNKEDLGTIQHLITFDD